MGELPPDTAGPEWTIDTGTGWFDVDTGLDDTGLNTAPAHTVNVLLAGHWELSPVTGTYTDLVGELVITEVVDGDEDLPSCTATFALTGGVSETACSTCDFAFEVEHYLAEDGAVLVDEDTLEETVIPGLSACVGPDQPVHEEIRRLGFSADEGTIYFDYHGSGIWLPWYDAELVVNEVSFSWDASFGVVVDEEDE